MIQYGLLGLSGIICLSLLEWRIMCLRISPLCLFLGEVQNESLAAGEGKKRAKRRQSRKPLFSLKRQRKGSSKGTSQESLLAGQTEDSDATADISTTGILLAR